MATQLAVITQRTTNVVSVAGQPLAVLVRTTSPVVQIANNVGSQGATGAPGPTGPPGVVPVFSAVGSVSIRTGTHRFYVEHAATLVLVRAAVATAPVGSALTVTARVNGTVVATVSIAAGSFTNTASLSRALVAGDYLTVDVTAIGSTTPGADLTVSASIE